MIMRNLDAISRLMLAGVPIAANPLMAGFQEVPIRVHQRSKLAWLAYHRRIQKNFGFCSEALIVPMANTLFCHPVVLERIYEVIGWHQGAVGSQDNGRIDKACKLK